MANFYTNCRCFGGSILYRGYERGIKIQRKITNYKPSLFLPANTPTRWQTLDGKHVNKRTFGSIREAKNFLEEYDEVENFRIYGNTKFEYCYLEDTFPLGVVYDLNKITIANIDIEVGSEGGHAQPTDAWQPITAITMRTNGKFYVYGCKKFITTRGDVIYRECGGEGELIQRFLLDWKRIDPDIVTGWFINFYDIPYLVNRITKVFDKKVASQLSPWGFFSERQVKLKQREMQSFDVVGVSGLDYFELYQKYTASGQPSNKLNYISHVELAKQKVDYSEYGSLRKLYKEDFQKFMEYNLRDVELVDELDRKLKFIPMVLAIAYGAKVNFSDPFTQVRMWHQIIFSELKKRNIAVPQRKRNQRKTEKYKGAHVKDPYIGPHNWCVTFDVASLYPSLIQMFNISPDMFVAEEFRQIRIDELLERTQDFAHLKQKDLALAANGHHFRVDKLGFLPHILNKMLKERSRYKELQIQAEQQLELVRNEMTRRGLKMAA